MMLIHGSNKKKMFCKFFETNDSTLVSKNLQYVEQLELVQAKGPEPYLHRGTTGHWRAKRLNTYNRKNVNYSLHFYDSTVLGTSGLLSAGRPYATV